MEQRIEYLYILKNKIINMNQINVQDKTITTTTVVKSIEIESAEVKLGQSAKVYVRLLDENGGLVGNEIVRVEGTDYENWGSDDQYLVDYILTTLGLTEI